MSDLDRLRRVYAARQVRISAETPLSTKALTNRHIHANRRRNLIATLDQLGLKTLASKQILEVGCGEGGVLSEWLGFGASHANTFGIDLLPQRLAHGHHRQPHLQLAAADGQTLPFPSRHFDIVLQFTALSSVLDGQIRLKMAHEMGRVLRHGGVILSYDFVFNPTNQNTVGITHRELRRLFPQHALCVQRITLAPPLARLIAPRSPKLAQRLERIRLANSHLLTVIRPTD